MNEMINALTKGIGVDLYKPIRISYYNNKSILEKNSKFQRSSKNKKNFLIDVMALSIFNQHAIIPLHGSANFASGTKNYGVTRIRMGTYHLDKEFYTAVNKITRQFYAIIRSYGLHVEQLHIASIKEFVNFWLEFTPHYGN